MILLTIAAVRGKLNPTNRHPEADNAHQHRECQQ